MTKNTLLNIGVFLCKLLCLFYILICIGTTAFLIHYQFNPKSYSNTKVYFDTGDSFRIETVKIDRRSQDENNSNYINNLSTSSLYFNFIKFLAILVLSFLCTREFQRVIESVKEIKTFKRRNVESFKKIGRYILIISLLMSFTVFNFNEETRSSFNISFTPLILALLAYIMAEIFKEGNKLSEENELTV